MGDQSRRSSRCLQPPVAERTAGIPRELLVAGGRGGKRLEELAHTVADHLPRVVFDVDHHEVSAGRELDQLDLGAFVASDPGVGAALLDFCTAPFPRLASAAATRSHTPASDTTVVGSTLGEAPMKPSSKFTRELAHNASWPPAE
jgi:hypothetical protein